MEAAAPIIEFAAYEKRLWSISTQLDPRERSLVLRFAQDLLMLGMDLDAAPHCPTNEDPEETRLHLAGESRSDLGSNPGFEPDTGGDLEGDDAFEGGDALEGLRLFHQTH